MPDDIQTFSTPEPGELLTVPPRESWKALLRANAAAAEAWDFEVAGVPFGEARQAARAEALSAGADFTRRIDALGAGICSGPSAPDGLIVATGHQPELFHPGIWAKNFLVDRLAVETGATGIDFVVDSDAFDVLEAAAPCMQPRIHRCSAALATATKDACFACMPAPTPEVINGFCAEVDTLLQTLCSSEPRVNFDLFCEALRRAAPAARTLGESVTFARRLYESPARTGYLELPVTSVGGLKAFAGFVLDIAANAERFSAAYNGELDAFREATATRSKVQPFPNLDRHGGRYELPFWALGAGRRATVWVEQTSDGKVLLRADDEDVGRFDGRDIESFVTSTKGLGLAPKALTLTMFVRVFVADLFVHGTGGARYDRVTDGVIRTYYGIEPPPFVVASLTERLPLEADIVTDQQVSVALERLNRFEHNPDAMLDQAHFTDPAVESRARTLAAEKKKLTAAIARPGADRKTMGSRIREVNEALRELLAPLGQELARAAEELRAARDASEVLEDRTYPFCYWDPRTIAEIARRGQ